MAQFHTLALVTLLSIGGAAQAQLKPSGPGTPPLPPSPKEAAQATKEIAARSAAERWLALLDAGEYAKAWDQGAAAFRSRVTKEQWVESLPKTRGAFGKVQSRRDALSSYKTSMPPMPEGEYVTVRFVTDFEKKSGAEELITLVHENGVWRALGYGIR